VHSLSGGGTQLLWEVGIEQTITSMRSLGSSSVCRSRGWIASCGGSQISNARNHI
jgi:hypothetical protein